MSGVNVFSHGSNFFIVIAPVSSIIDFKNVGLGNCALHLPHILSLQLAEGLPLCLVPFLFWPLSQLCTFERINKSSTVCLNFDHHESRILHALHGNSFILGIDLHFGGGGSGIVSVGSE